MKAIEFLTEGPNHPIIVVDVQPAYADFDPGIFKNIIDFVNKSRGPVLMFVNAEQDGLTNDTISDVMNFWDNTISGEPVYNDENDAYAEPDIQVNWDRFTIVDKGYGYLRSWMDNNVSSALIIKIIRLMYQSNVNDSRQLFNGEDDPDYEENMRQLAGKEYQDWMLTDPLTTEWTSIAQLKQFTGAYIVGGGRNECLREVELLMNAFNIKCKRINKLTY